MAEDRRNNSELLETLKEFKQDIKEDIKEIKDELKQIDLKIKDQIDVNNKIYMNGFPAEKHVADHHVLDNLVAHANNTKSFWQKILEELVKYVAIGILSWAAATWYAGLSEVQSPFANKPKVEQHDKNSK